MWDLMDHMMEQRMFPGYQANKPPEGWEYEERTPGASSQQAASPAQRRGDGENPQGWTTENGKEATNV
jgi:hypothetical protein